MYASINIIKKPNINIKLYLYSKIKYKKIIKLFKILANSINFRLTCYLIKDISNIIEEYGYGFYI